MNLDIFSDPVCPWCYIGLTNLGRAMEARPEHPFTLGLHPFRLNPEMPSEGMNRRAYLEAKFGGASAVDMMHRNLASIGAKAGLKVDWETPEKAPNTLDAHRLIRWATIEGRGWPMTMALFRGYWREGRDIGDAAVLADLGSEVGLDRAMLEVLLSGEADRAEIAAEDEGARRMGITGVPAFVIGGRHLLAGAQPHEVWVQIIDQLNAAAAGKEAKGEPAAGDIPQQ